MAAGSKKHAVRQKIVSLEDLSVEKPVISLTEMQAAFSDGNRSFKTDKQMQEWIGTSRVVDVGHHRGKI